MLFLSQPLLSFTVTGIGTMSTIDSTIDFTLSGSFIKAHPAFDLFVTLVTGHPMLMSMISTFVFSQMYFDAKVRDSKSEPTICCEIGCS